MAFVKLVKGRTKRTVPESVAKNFLALGYSIANEEVKETKKQKPEKAPAPVPYIDKPIGQWSKQELKEYADNNEIDLTGVTKADEVREIIKAHLEGE